MESTHRCLWNFIFLFDTLVLRERDEAELKQLGISGQIASAWFLLFSKEQNR